MENIRPNMFSNIPQRYVGTKRADSLFFIKVQVASTDYKVQIKEHLVNNCGIRSKAVDKWFQAVTVATGFTAVEVENFYYILTCAHLFEYFYSAEIKVDCDKLNSWFNILIICQHYESDMIANHPNLYADPSNDPRFYSPARIVKLDQSKDLMLLKVSKRYLYGNHTMQLCQMPHPVLSLATVKPRPADDIMLVSWPPCRKDSVITGQLVARDRVYGQLTQYLSKGYSMRLVELNVVGGAGCSGAPVLSHQAAVIGLYHGRIESLGYAVSAADIYEFCLGAHQL